MATKYKALLVAPDGAWVTDYRSNTVHEVMDALADRGSRWYFYPFEFVITDRGSSRMFTRPTQRIVHHPYCSHDFRGKTIRTVCKRIAAGELDHLMDGG